jgi:hypothetical protein
MFMYICMSQKYLTTLYINLTNCIKLVHVVVFFLDIYIYMMYISILFLQYLALVY